MFSLKYSITKYVTNVIVLFSSDVTKLGFTKH